MKLSLVRLAALALPLAAIVGCAVAPEEGTGTSSSDLTLTPSPPPVVTLSPMSLCETVRPAETLPLTSSQQIFAGTSPSTGGCDFSVFELTGTADHAFNLILTEVRPDPSEGLLATYPLEPPYTSIPQSSCAASYVEYQAFGWLPPTFNIVGNGVVGVPGRWESISEGTIYGTWAPAGFGNPAECNFVPLNFGPNSGLRVASGAFPYTEVRLAAKSVAYTSYAATPVRGPLFAYAQEP